MSSPLKRRRLSFTPSSVSTKVNDQSLHKDYSVKKYAKKFTLKKIPKQIYVGSILPKLTINNKFFYPGNLLPITNPIRGRPSDEYQLNTDWRFPANANGTFTCTQSTGVDVGYGNQLLVQIPINSLLEVAAIDNKLQADMPNGYGGVAANQLLHLNPDTSPDATSIYDAMFRSRKVLIEQYKIVYTIENVTNNDIVVDLNVFKPKHVVSELRQDKNYETVLISGNVTLMKVQSYINNTPLGLLTHDINSNPLKSNVALPYNSSPVYSGSSVSVDERIRPISKHNVAVNYHYDVVQKNTFRIQPGAKITYEVAIPGHMCDFDKLHQLSQATLRASGNASAGTKIDYTESMMPLWYYGSRFLVIRAWNQTLHNPNGSAAVSGALTTGSLKIATSAKKYASYRRVLRSQNDPIIDCTLNDIDALGCVPPSNTLMDTTILDYQVDINPDTNTGVGQLLA